MPANSTILGAAGEHFVMCQLLRRDMIAALAPAGVPNADIIVSDKVGDRLCAVQVKVRRERGADGGWHMKKKHEDMAAPTLFYSFVQFADDMAIAPKCWIVPSRVVAAVLKLSHEKWLAAPGRNGQAHNDSEMRRFLPSYDKFNCGKKYSAGWLDQYADGWKLLERQSAG